MELWQILWWTEGIRDIIGHFSHEANDPGDSGKSPWLTVFETIVPSIVGAALMGWVSAVLTPLENSLAFFVIFLIGSALSQPMSNWQYTARNFLTGAAIVAMYFSYVVGLI